MNIVLKLCAKMLCLCWHKFSMYFSILNGVKIKITHNVVPINLHSSINATGISQCVNVCPVLTDLDG